MILFYNIINFKVFTRFFGSFLSYLEKTIEKKNMNPQSIVCTRFSICLMKIMNIIKCFIICLLSIEKKKEKNQHHCKIIIAKLIDSSFFF